MDGACRDGLGPLRRRHQSVLPGLGDCSCDSRPPASRLPHKLPAWNWPRSPPVSLFANLRSIHTPYLSGWHTTLVPLMSAPLSITHLEIWHMGPCPSRRRGVLKTQGDAPTPVAGSRGPGSGPWGSPTSHRPTPLAVLFAMGTLSLPVLLFI